jgi:xanthine dehydrogenase YagS FAD-binding subunit
MKNFTYYRPTTVEQAVGLLGNKWGPAELLAGGTDLLDLQKEYVAQPEKVISVTAIKELQGIKFSRPEGLKVGEIDYIYIGAGTKLTDIAEDKELKRLVPALTSAASIIGGPQIRNMGTLGGNLCQRNRCWYFRDEHVNCFLKGGEKCFALDGENQFHAVFTQGHKCVIVHPSTLAPALIALGAIAKVQGPKGPRTIKLAEFFHAPTAANEREHVLQPDDIVLSVGIPQNGTEWLASASYEVRHKQSYDWPLVQAAVAMKLDGGKAKDVRVVLGHVAPTPHVAKDAAAALEGKEITEETAAAAGAAAAKGAKPLSQNAYKLRLIEVAVKRAALTAAGKKKYWEV